MGGWEKPSGQFEWSAEMSGELGPDDHCEWSSVLAGQMDHSHHSHTDHSFTNFHHSHHCLTTQTAFFPDDQLTPRALFSPLAPLSHHSNNCS